MTEDKAYLKRQLNQACNSTRCIYQFFIDNLVSDGYHMIYSTVAYRVYCAVFQYPTSQISIRRCENSFKVYMSILDNYIVKESSYKLVGKYK